MNAITLQGLMGNSNIVIGETIRHLPKYINRHKTVIITDENVYRFYHKYFDKYDVIKIGCGESIKNLETVNNIYLKLLKYEVDRSSFIVGVGGGIVTDITGFVASTFMRGVLFGYVASTLVGQVDASVGGKTGVNLLGYKNMVGVFNQPQFVLCDLNMLETLPSRELSNGFAEVIKSALIKDHGFFDFLELNYAQALSLDKDVLEEIVSRSLKIKIQIVENDESEKGERRILNFGHTFGHALEKVAGLSHGEAVSVGIVVAAKISKKRYQLSEEAATKILQILKKYHLPTEMAFDKQAVLSAIRKDKKRAGDVLHFVLLNGIGQAKVETVSFKELESVLDDLC